MKAIILVAGYATRLYPLTQNMPKALLPIAGKPIIDYIVSEMNTIEAIDKIYVVSNSKFARHFNEWADKTQSKKSIVVLDDGTSTEDERRGAIGDILFTIDKGSIDDDLMIIAGDNFFNFKLLDYYNFFMENYKDSIAVKEIDNIDTLRQFAVAMLDADGKVTDLEEKPKNPKSNTGVYASYIYRKDTLPLFKQYSNEGHELDAPGYFVQWLYKIKDVFAYKFDGECYDIGTFEAYEKIQEIMEKQSHE